MNLFDLFSEDIDADDFTTDVRDLKSQQDSLFELLFQVAESSSNQESDVLKMKNEREKFDLLLKHQENIKNSYKTIRSPSAPLEISNAQLKFDAVIGKGGFGVVWKGRFQGTTVKNIDIGGYKKDISFQTFPKSYRILFVGSEYDEKTITSKNCHLFRCHNR